MSDFMSAFARRPGSAASALVSPGNATSTPSIDPNQTQVAPKPTQVTSLSHPAIYFWDGLPQDVRVPAENAICDFLRATPILDDLAKKYGLAVLKEAFTTTINLWFDDQYADAQLDPNPDKKSISYTILRDYNADVNMQHTENGEPLDLNQSLEKYPLPEAKR